MWWEKLLEGIDWFFNKPLPIVGVSLFIVCVFAWKIFKGSSFGKKQLNKMKLKVDALELACKEKLQRAEALVDEYKKKSDAKVNAIQAYYETKLAQKQAIEDELSNLVCAIGDNIHNDKIKVLVSEYREKSNASQTIMTDRIEKVKAEYDDRLKALEDKLYGKEKELGSSKEE